MNRSFIEYDDEDEVVEEKTYSLDTSLMEEITPIDFKKENNYWLTMAKILTQGVDSVIPSDDDMPPLVTEDQEEDVPPLVTEDQEDDDVPPLVTEDQEAEIVIDQPVEEVAEETLIDLSMSEETIVELPIEIEETPDGETGVLDQLSEIKDLVMNMVPTEEIKEETGVHLVKKAEVTRKDLVMTRTQVLDIDFMSVRPRLQAVYCGIPFDENETCFLDGCLRCYPENLLASGYDEIDLEKLKKQIWGVENGEKYIY